MCPFALRLNAQQGVAQLVEYVVWDHGVGGSNPSTLTIMNIAGSGNGIGAHFDER